MNSYFKFHQIISILTGDFHEDRFSNVPFPVNAEFHPARIPGNFKLSVAISRGRFWLFMLTFTWIMKSHHSRIGDEVYSNHITMNLITEPY